ncbi:MAG: cytochrome b/b6 domain-containing protein [Pseudomonadota bacterium]|nr:cytochrome b/b6 domain-containing protein [Pseudomonadota bacterium]MDO7710376.1 cytochrome b/b6 domain-containing protein [Pseudomonadota bacterium]
MTTTQQIKVWDLPLRIFHWSLVSCFFIAYFTEDNFMTLHTYAGYTIIGLIIFRLIWGVIGNHHARFNNFVCRPRTVRSYLKDILYNQAKRYLGHNPAGAAMILALILSLITTTISGLAIYATEEMAGPFVGLMMNAPDFIYDGAEDIHEFFANFTLTLVGLHIVGVLLASISHKENLIRAMWTGNKAVKNNDS